MTKGEGAIYDWYNGPFAQWLGLGCATGFRLSEADIQKISSLGIPISAVANAEEGRRKCGNEFGANIDIGILLAIMEHEDNYGLDAYELSLDLYRSGYSADQSVSQKVDSLQSWNSSYPVRVATVARAQALNAVVGAINIFTDVTNFILRPGESLIGDFKLLLIKILDSIDLLPDRVGWLEMPLREEDLNTDFYEDGISQDYMDTHYDSRGHPGIDYVCRQIGVDVLALANGVIIEPSPGTLMYTLSVSQKGSNYGNNVWIDHGGGLFALYAHLNTLNVDVGDEVVQGQVIGGCGSTGNSTGPHVHLQVLNIHPSEMVTYRQEDPGNINPHDVLGTCFAFKIEEDDDEEEE
jgi:hypothetical protein